jgi:peptidoglycan endopeptidase LytF
LYFQIFERILMQKIYKLLLGILLVSPAAAVASNKIDSIGVENNKGKKVIIYKVEAKETYYSISKKYNIPYKDLMEFNDAQFLQIGVTLKIPTQMPFTGTSSVEPVSNSATATNNTATIAYTIKAKDNLNMLAEKYGTTVNELKRVNNLTSINLQIGQVLQIPSSGAVIEETVTTPVTTYTPPVKTSVTTPSETTSTHTVKAKENLNLIAQMYGSTVDHIKTLNGLSSNNLQIGQILKIPATGQSIETASTVKVEPKVETSVQKVAERPVVEKPAVKLETTNTDGNIEHVVAAGETIYSIAKKFNTTTYQITTANNLTSNSLKVGQRLTIKNTAPVGVNSVQQQTSDEAVESMVTPTLKGAPSKYGISQLEERGVGVWIEDQDLDPNKMLILHRTAPVGTIIKITNPMSSRSTFAKVVGKFTENETTKDVIIVMTKAVADAIGALDKRFACTLSYGAIDNDQ